jgi:alpha-beta hydrolase superfamily lysophospholipase
MSHYVLIHGAWEEAKSWDAVTPLLEAQGHSVNAVDLPGHGKNLQPISQMNMNNYINTVITEIQQVNVPVILVAHSMTGSVVSQVAERIP